MQRPKVGGRERSTARTPILYGRTAFEQPRNGHIFINVRPVDAIALAEQFERAKLLGGCAGKAWEPGQRNRQNPPISE
jgi:hypothetical protein